MAKPLLPARVLLVEDELALASTIGIALRSLGSPDVLHARSLKEARAALADEQFDLILLDRMLPDGDGLDFCASLRKRKFGGAILMLTAKGEVDERVKGLQAGADDYLPKPFALEELKARIEAIARRLPKNARPADAKGSEAADSSPLWTRDKDRLRILGPRGWATLTPLEFKLADHLISADGGIVSREELLKEVWGFRFLPKTRTVDYFLGRLRKHFEADPDEPRHFLTVRGAGYRFVASG